MKQARISVYRREMPVRMHHQVRVEDANAHMLGVESRIEGATGDELVLSMPVWTPGSYLVREYARHVERVSASASDGPLSFSKIRKNAWRVRTGGRSTFTLRYSVYCNDLSVRTNHVDASHAYFNGASTFLYPESTTSVSGTVSVVVPDGARVSTALPSDGQSDDGVARFRYESFDELCDSPFEVGRHDVLSVEAGGQTHDIAIWSPGYAVRRDDERLLSDVKKIVETEANLFGGLPDGRYLFILHFAAGGRGGLEHRASSSLIASPYVFEHEKGYEDLLSLVAHEYLHRWHVKRTRPAPLVPYDYERESYTRQLWLFEGATSYYDWYVLRRAGIVTPRRFLEHLAEEIARLDDVPGRFVQSLEDASFDAWVKLYRPDENSSNSTVSYYLKGEIVCALLDIAVRARSKGERTFDDVMRAALAQGGDGTPGLPEGGFDALVREAAGVDVSDLVERWVRGREEIDYAAALAPVGLEARWTRRDGSPSAALGLRVRPGAGSAAVVSVIRGSPAERAGLEAGDEIVALDGIRVDDARMCERLRPRNAGDRVRITLFRRERLVETEATLEPARPDQLAIVPLAGASAGEVAMRAQWLAGELEAAPA